jgi:MoxR-like ATPase
VEASYAELVRELLAEGLELSDRRIVKGLKLVAGAALLRRAEEAGPEDLWPLNYFWLGVEEAEVARRVIQPRVDAGGGPRLDSTRSVDEILADLSVIRAQEPRLHSEVALGAHLKAINRLRRELIRDHPGDVDARRTVEEAVQFVMKRLGGLDV